MWSCRCWLGARKAIPSQVARKFSECADTRRLGLTTPVMQGLHHGLVCRRGTLPQRLEPLLEMIDGAQLAAGRQHRLQLRLALLVEERFAADQPATGTAIHLATGVVRPP